MPIRVFKSAMKFQFPDATGFEVPDEWWRDAGMTNFVPRRRCYAHTPTDEKWAEVQAMIVPLTAIRPVIRTTTLDFGGFERDRLVDVLKAFTSDIPIPPIRARATLGDQYAFA